MRLREKKAKDFKPWEEQWLQNQTQVNNHPPWFLGGTLSYRRFQKLSLTRSFLPHSATTFLRLPRCRHGNHKWVPEKGNSKWIHHLLAGHTGSVGILRTILFHVSDHLSITDGIYSPVLCNPDLAMLATDRPAGLIPCPLSFCLLRLRFLLSNRLRMPSSLSQPSALNTREPHRITFFCKLHSLFISAATEASFLVQSSPMYTNAMVSKWFPIFPS